MTKKIEKVAIMGGTHGNERTGVFLVNKWLKNKDLLKRETFETMAMISNPKAVEANLRYIDFDLNRSFIDENFEDYLLAGYEHNRAKIINQVLGPKGDAKYDFIIDMHSTTGNMKLTLILHSNDDFTNRMAAYLLELNSEVRIFRWLGTEDRAFLNTISPMGFAIEVGPVPQGILDAGIFAQTEELTYQVLDYIDRANQDKLDNKKRKLTIYDHYKIIDFPKYADGSLAGMIHPNLQYKDFEEVKPGDPLFVTFEGKEVLCEEDEPVYPVFINEAAYYEKGIAMCLTKKVEFEV